MLRLVALAALLLAGLGVPAGAQQETLRVRFLDVGQADAVLVEAPGLRLLYDAGRGQDVLAWLDEFGVDTLDAVVASHGHADHIGGIEWVLRNRVVRAYLDNGNGGGSATLRSLRRSARELGVPWVVVAPGKRTVEQGGVRLTWYGPPADAEDENNASVGLLVEYGAFSVLLTGDAERPELRHFIDLGVPRVTVLKASHHGADDGVNPGWIMATRPEVVVISVGATNGYGHPCPNALSYYRRYARAIYRTDRHGTVTITGRKDGTWRAETGAVEIR